MVVRLRMAAVTRLAQCLVARSRSTTATLPCPLARPRRTRPSCSSYQSTVAVFFLRVPPSEQQASRWSERPAQTSIQRSPACPRFHQPSRCRFEFKTCMIPVETLFRMERTSASRRPLPARFMVAATSVLPVEPSAMELRSFKTPPYLTSRCYRTDLCPPTAPMAPLYRRRDRRRPRFCSLPRRTPRAPGSTLPHLPVGPASFCHGRLLSH